MSVRENAPQAQAAYRAALEEFLLSALPKGKRKAHVQELVEVCFKWTDLVQITPADQRELMGSLEMRLKDFKYVQRPLTSSDNALIESINMQCLIEHVKLRKASVQAVLEAKPAEGALVLGRDFFAR